MDSAKVRHLESLIERVIEIQETRGSFIMWEDWYTYIFHPLYERYIALANGHHYNYDLLVRNKIARDCDMCEFT